MDSAAYTIMSSFLPFSVTLGLECKIVDNPSLIRLAIGKRFDELDGGSTRMMILLRVPQSPIWRRVLSLLVIRARVALSRRILATLGCREWHAFALYPTCESPTVIYQIASRASSYVEDCILPRPSYLSLRGILRKLIRCATGVDPGIGGVMLTCFH